MIRTPFGALAASLGIAASFGGLCAHAWEEHRLLMPGVVASLPAGTRSQNLSVPAAEESARVWRRLKGELNLNERAALPVLAFAAGSSITIEQLLLSPAVDEPDLGMDQDLPDAWDPLEERTWMGGRSGSTSQGFRHMFFGGWKLTRPLASFQLPLRAIGRAPARVQLLLETARKLAREGHAFWAWRVRAWAIHFIQDLAQPFHSTQVPHLGLVPWYHLAHWPLTESFKTFVPETTRVLGNYHLGYERVIRAELLRDGVMGHEWKACWTPPRDAWSDGTEHPISAGAEGMALALAVARDSSEIAWELGSALDDLFGPAIRRQGVSVAQNGKDLDVDTLLRDPSTLAARRRIETLTCRALGRAAVASRALLLH